MYEFLILVPFNRNSGSLRWNPFRAFKWVPEISIHAKRIARRRCQFDIVAFRKVHFAELAHVSSPPGKYADLILDRIWTQNMRNSICIADLFGKFKNAKTNLSQIICDVFTAELFRGSTLNVNAFSPGNFRWGEVKSLKTFAPNC